MMEVDVLSPQLIVVRGGRKVSGTFAIMRRWAVEIQQEVAEAFAAESAYGGLLMKNSAAYDARKAREGYDTRRGHRTGELQLAMEETQCWRVRARGKNDVELEFSDAFLKRLAPYALFYIESKTRRGVVMSATRAQLKGMERELRENAKRQEEKRGRSETARRVPPAARQPRTDRQPPSRAAPRRMAAPRVGTRVTLGSLRSLGDQFRRRAIGG